MGYVTDVSTLCDIRSRKLKDFVERYNIKPVAFYDSAPVDEIVIHSEWHTDANGKYCVMETKKGKFAFHRELSQVVAL